MDFSPTIISTISICRMFLLVIDSVAQKFLLTFDDLFLHVSKYNVSQLSICNRKSDGEVGKHACIYIIWPLLLGSIDPSCITISQIRGHLFSNQYVACQLSSIVRANVKFFCLPWQLEDLGNSLIYNKPHYFTLKKKDFFYDLLKNHSFFFNFSSHLFCGYCNYG